MVCPFEEVGRGLAGNLTLPSGTALPVIAVQGLTCAWLKVGARSRLEILTR